MASKFQVNTRKKITKREKGEKEEKKLPFEIRSPGAGSGGAGLLYKLNSIIRFLKLCRGVTLMKK